MTARKDTTLRRERRGRNNANTYIGPPLDGLRVRTHDTRKVPLWVLVIHALRGMPVGIRVEPVDVLRALPEGYAVPANAEARVRGAITQTLRELADPSDACLDPAVTPERRKGVYRIVAGVYRPQTSKERWMGVP